MQIHNFLKGMPAKEKLALKSGRLLNYYKINFSTSGNYPQADNIKPLGFWLERIIKNLSDNALTDFGRNQHGR